MKRSRPTFRFRGLAAQIVLWTVLPLTLVLIGVAFTGVYSHEQAMRSLVEERDQALATASAGQVREVLLQRASALRELAAQHAFHEKDVAKQRSLLAHAGDLRGLLSAEGVALVDDAGSPLLNVNGPPPWMQGAPEATLSALTALAQAVTARQDLTVSPVFDMPGASGLPAGRSTLLMGVPVHDTAGAMVGVLVGPVSLSSLGLESLLSRVQVGVHGVVYLVEPSGGILVHTQSEHARTSLAEHSGLATALQDASPGATFCQAPDGERMTLAYAPVGASTGWRVIVEQPWHEVVSPVLRYSQAMPLVAVLAAIVALLALYYGVHSLVRPLRALGRQAEQVAWGDFEATNTPVGGVEEIEDLHRTLDQMAKRIQSYQRGMHNYIAAITQGQEDERRRLARELHDDTAQSLIALGQQVEMAQKLLATDPGRAADRLATVRTMLAETLQGVRRFSRDLRPIYLEDLGFIPGLQMLVSEAEQRGSLSIQFSTIGTVRRLPPDVELTAYRVVQEALNNVIQHSKASRALVEVRFACPAEYRFLGGDCGQSIEAQGLVLTVRDDGQGFDAPDLPDALAREGHFGLMGIQERALLYGGKLTIRSAPGQGTEVTLCLPYPPESQPRQMAGERMG